MNLRFEVLVKPEAVAQYKDAIQEHLFSLSKDDRALRFFSSSEASVDFWLTKITTSGPIKHIILLVFNHEKVVAVGDLAYSNKESAEMALSVSSSVRKVAVTSDEKGVSNLKIPDDDSGKKLAEWVIHALIDIAKDYKFSEVVYSTLPENIAMLNLGKRLGFSQKWIDGAIKGVMQFKESK